MDGGEKVKAKPLLVEFSIENRHVVKMRADKLKRSQAPKIDVSQPDVLGVKRRRREVDNDETDGIKKRVKVEGERKPTRPNKTRGKPPSRANKRPKH
ncbi:hypothetical protein FRB94_002694 [Tulasnella sp. JGI-2019a]|nr:hypothetical protein FRB94_002694 [Tulasnella sp. JGI-2019a]